MEEDKEWLCDRIRPVSFRLLLGNGHKQSVWIQRRRARPILHSDNMWAANEWAVRAATAAGYWSS